MKTGYFDCFSGVSGDMILGSIVDAGLKIEELQKGLSALKIDGYKVSAYKVKKEGIEGTKVDVIIPARPAGGEEPSYSLRKYKDIKAIITNSAFDDLIKERMLKVFNRLAEAEARVHGTDIEVVSFHEVGAMDAIIDVAGTILGLHILGIEKVLSSPINTGSGFFDSHHGVFPIPAPATMEMLKGFPIYSSGINKELATPTGVALLTTLADRFCPLPVLEVVDVGYGAGTWDLHGSPNLLRLVIGETKEFPSSETIILIETNIDDLNPQIYEYLMDRLFGAGALDVYLAPIIMKKGRPGVILSAMMEKGVVERVMRIVFEETGTLGIRIREVERIRIQREIREIDTAWGRIRIKIASQNGQVIGVSPEYEDCKKIAEEKGIPLRMVMDEIRKLTF